MALAAGLNQSACDKLLQLTRQADALRIQSNTLNCGAHVVDFGVQVPGGIQAGLGLATLCMGDRASVQVASGDRAVWSGPWISVATDHPIEACMFSQYAGWPVQHDKFFAMGSGPMRVRRGREEILEHLDASDPQPLAVGTLECDQLPTCEIASAIAAECDVSESQLWLAVAPTRSVAGCIQVVARSIETALHKMHELGFPLQSVVQGYGTAPLCPPVPDFVAGIGRTNDAILYGGHVSLWVSCDDDQVETVVDQLPSCASSDYGQPFVEIFAKYDHDFYKVDPNLFSPAEIMICNQKTGKVWRRGRMREEIIEKSFAVS